MKETEVQNVERRIRPGRVVLAIFIIAIIIAAIILGIFYFPISCSNDANLGKYNNLVVDLDRLNLPNNSREFIDYSMPNRSEERVEKSGFSDAVSMPFKDKSEKALYEELKDEILRNPVLGDMVARGLSSLKADGKTVVEWNPWIKDFIGKTDQAMKLDLIQKPRGMEIWLTCTGDGTILVTEKYFRYAAGLDAILDRLVKVGIDNPKSVENYCLPLVVLASNTRTEKADYQEDKEAFILKYVRKDGKVEFIIGFNLKDKRIEIFEDIPKTGEKVTPPGGGGGSDDPDPPTPTQPTPTEKKYVKDPSKDPVYQGNADIGGGKNKDSDGTGNYQPEKPEWQSNDHSENSGGSSSGGGNSSHYDHEDNATPPPTDPIPVHEDSHDATDHNAGNGNGEFSAPD